eukprot:5615144-Prorocentrum_lima.AAC.1
MLAAVGVRRGGGAQGEGGSGTLSALVRASTLLRRSAQAEIGSWRRAAGRQARAPPVGGIALASSTAWSDREFH